MPGWCRERLAELEQTSVEISAMLDLRELQYAATIGRSDPWEAQAEEDEIEALRDTLRALGEEMATLREGWKAICARAGTKRVE